jgi:hypothetical protein
VTNDHVRDETFTVQTFAGFSDRNPIGYRRVELTQIIVRLGSARARFVIDDTDVLEQGI